MPGETLILVRVVPKTKFVFTSEPDEHGSPSWPFPFQNTWIVFNSDDSTLIFFEHFIKASQVLFVPRRVVNVD